ncbi:hypothetical protein N0V90_002915 [Kalmusia sp. IMI 367209]|nr:hypothetical protein N0V90_002915 [Kalmusia sp. IMI 367209]
MDVAPQLLFGMGIRIQNSTDEVIRALISYVEAEKRLTRPHNDTTVTIDVNRIACEGAIERVEVKRQELKAILRQVDENLNVFARLLSQMPDQWRNDDGKLISLTRRFIEGEAKIFIRAHLQQYHDDNIIWKPSTDELKADTTRLAQDMHFLRTKYIDYRRAMGGGLDLNVHQMMLVNWWEGAEPEELPEHEQSMNENEGNQQRGSENENRGEVQDDE